MCQTDLLNEIRALIKKSLFSDAIKKVKFLLLKGVHFDPDLMLKMGRTIELIPLSEFKNAGYLVKKVFIGGGYTTKFLRLALISDLLKHRIIAQILESEYDTVEHVALFGDQRIESFQPDIFYFCIGLEYKKYDQPQDELERWTRCINSVRERMKCTILCNNFIEPDLRLAGSFDASYPMSDLYFVRRFNEMISENIGKSTHVVDVNFLSGYFGRRNWQSPRNFALAKLPVNQEFLPEYAAELGRVISAIYGKSKKCLILDLDNTLWGGVIGDDGINGIHIGEDSGIGESFKKFQRFCLKLRQRGIILAVCSKNDLSVAKAPFLERTDMVLKLDDFSCFIANWDPKHVNIMRIVDKLNIGLDSCVFVDDNPAEREIVKRNLPTVSVVDLPVDVADYPRALSMGGHFEAISITKDDLQRTEQYTSNASRQDLEVSFENYEDYLRALDMKGIFKPFDLNNITRITQLVNKTNQFNLTTLRYVESELSARIGNNSWLTRYVKLRDKFGDNGLISVFSGKISDDGKTLDVDLWLMSCRVLKRGLERRLFEDILLEAHQRQISTIAAYYLKTDRNGMVSNLLKDMQFHYIGKDETGKELYRFLLNPDSLSIFKERSEIIKSVEENLYC